jgi:hypothetical protein
VAEAVNAKFGVAVTRQHVHLYDPACKQPPAPRWRALHAATRRAFIAETAKIGAAQKNVRLRMLDGLVRGAMAEDKLALAAAILEQAAKECGGLYERKRRSRP